MRRPLTHSILLLCGAVCAFCWAQRTAHALREARADQARLQAALAILRHSTGALRDQAARLDRQIGELQGKAKRNQGSAPSARDLQAAAQNAHFRDMFLDPRYQALRLKYTLAVEHVQYAAFFRSAGLSRAQREQFEKAEADYEGRTLDIAATSEALGLPPGSADLKDIDRANRDAKAQAEAAILTPEQAQDLAAFRQSFFSRQTTREIDSDLYFGATPLTPSQRSAIQAAITASGGTSSPDATSPPTVDWDRVQALCAGALSQPQAEAFETRIADAQYSEQQDKMIHIVQGWEESHPVIASK